jgi:hypothetical protein
MHLDNSLLMRIAGPCSDLSFADLAYYLTQSPDEQEILAGSAPADFIACNLPNL